MNKYCLVKYDNDRIIIYLADHNKLKNMEIRVSRGCFCKIYYKDHILLENLYLVNNVIIMEFTGMNWDHYKINQSPVFIKVKNCAS